MSAAIAVIGVGIGAVALLGGFGMMSNTMKQMHERDMQTIDKLIQNDKEKDMMLMQLLAGSMGQNQGMFQMGAMNGFAMSQMMQPHQMMMMNFMGQSGGQGGFPQYFGGSYMLA